MLDASSIHPVHIIGASGRSGAALVRALLAHGFQVVPVVRNADRWAATRIDLPARLADLGDPASLADALGDASLVVSAAHARHAKAVLMASPATASFVFMGSTRKFTHWPDAHGNGVLAGEKAFMDSGRSGVMLHPTMIYGAQGEDNVQRLAALMRRLPFLPLPSGGRMMVQPIHQDDVSACLIAALGRSWVGPHSIVIAGPEKLRYADFAAEIACAAGFKPKPILPVPLWMPLALTPLTILPFLPRIRPAELRRLTENKTFDIAPMQRELRVFPKSLAEGLRTVFTSIK